MICLLYTSESLSNLTNWKDRGTCILFGDGAGAAVVRAGGERYYLPVTHSEGSKGDALTCKSRYQGNGLTSEINLEEMIDDEHFMQMDGQAVFKFAVKKVPEVIREVLEANEDVYKRQGLSPQAASQSVSMVTIFPALR